MVITAAIILETLAAIKKMEKVTYKIESEIELYRITSLLEELQIPYIQNLKSDSSFPVLNKVGEFGEISIPKEYEARAHHLFIKTEKQSIVVENKNNRATPNATKFWHIGLIIYSIIVTIIAIKYWHIDYRNKSDKNFIYKWNIENSELSLINKKTGKTIQLFKDLNYDLNYERSITYSSEGIKTSISIDNNEDGFFEHIYSLSKNGELTGESFDLNNDGNIEKMTIILLNGDTLKLVDKNEDGFFELKKGN